jgi:hypothetical protein
MFPKETGFHPTLIQNFSLPRKLCSTNLISATFSEFIAEQQQQQPAADLSIIFVDFTPTDKIRDSYPSSCFNCWSIPNGWSFVQLY